MLAGVGHGGLCPVKVTSGRTFCFKEFWNIHFNRCTRSHRGRDTLVVGGHVAISNHAVGCEGKTTLECLEYT